MRHWKTEIVANHVEMLSGRRKKDYADASAANALATQAAVYGEDEAASAAASEPLVASDEAEEDDEADEAAEAKEAETVAA